MGNTNVKPHPKPRSKKQLHWKAADRPAPPGKPSLNQENGFIPNVLQIHWTKSEKEGGSTVTTYLVEHRRLGTTYWQKSSQYPVLTNELAVNDLEPGWRYQFRVRAENAVGLSDPSEISEPYTVTLQRSAIAAPKFTQELNDLVILEDGKVQCEVHFLGQPLPNICWFKDSFEIFSGNRTKITTECDKSVLTILHTTAADEGKIKCTATNRAGHASTKCKLTIEATPSIKLPKSYQDQDGIIFEIGETINLNVTVSGRPTPLIFWSHDGESIQNNDRYEIEYNDKIASVKIGNALRSDRGEYQIKAVNKLGQDQASFLVTITDKPTPPGKARVLFTSGKSVTLSWSTPEDDGGCRIGNYIIEYYRLGWNVWLKAATTRQLSTMLGDLIEGSQYKFRIKAESPYGVSDPSEESEVVVIPDLKRGIRDPADVKQIQTESQIPIPHRRRANSTPRVSFVLDDVPVRPERKKTERTPEASPRLKRKQISTLSRNIKALGSDPFLNRELSIPSSKIHISVPGTSSPLSRENSYSSSLRKRGASNYSAFPMHMTPNIGQREQNKSPSPEIIITDADVDRNRSERSPSLRLNYFEKSPSVSPEHGSSTSKQSDLLRITAKKNPKSPEKSPSNRVSSFAKGLDHFEKFSPRSPNQLEKLPFFIPNNAEKSLSDSTHPGKSPSPTGKYEEKSPPCSPNRSPKLKRHAVTTCIDLEGHHFDTNAEIQELTKDDKSPRTMDRMRPALTRQAFSGSSEFMLVLCPEEEQGTTLRKFDISFEESSIPPPLSLSAPELGFDPPELPQLKRSSSSSELLTYHLMERLHEAVMKQDNVDAKLIKGQLSIPTIQVNSALSRNVIQEKPSSTRRLSGIIPTNLSSWSHQRYSLKNPKEINATFGSALQRFEENAEMTRELTAYRKISESEEEKFKTMETTELLDEEQWMKDNEESESSEEENATYLANGMKISDVFQSQNSQNHTVKEEMKKPGNQMMSAIKSDENQPFEILTVRKNPPDSNIIPKPILKKTSHSGEENRRIYTESAKSPISSIPRDTQRECLTPKKKKSNSFNESVDEEIDVDQIRKSPTLHRRRSLSLIPSSSNLIQNAFKPKSQRELIQSATSRDETTKNVSALASFTSIAGASFIIPQNIQENRVPEEMQGKKETQEESKVVVDFYGDIVKNFGGKSKPTAEFSRMAVSKYDTYEERRISDIKPNVDSLSLPAQSLRPLAPKTSISETESYSTEGSKRKSLIPSTYITKIQSNLTPTKREPLLTEHSKPEGGTIGGYGEFSPNKVDSYSNEYQVRQEDIKLIKYPYTNKMTSVDDESQNKSTNINLPVGQSNILTKSSIAHRHDECASSSQVSEKIHRKSRSSSRPGSRQSSVGRRKRTPISRDVSTSPVKFLDDWDSQCSSRNSLGRDYYNGGSLTTSRASSLSRRSLSPPRPKLREITTQTSIGLGASNSHNKQQTLELAKKADKRMRIIFEYFTDLAMISVASSLYLFHHEYYALPFLLILIYRQLGEKIQNFNEAIQKWIPRWIQNRFRRKS